jgi:serine/threonine protein kinase
MIESGTLLQKRYQVDKQIGQGGMGAVYMATDVRFGSVVAIKETFFADEQFGKAFEREARLLNNLKHPALPRVSDHFVDENGQFLVMEYIEGEDLSEMLEKRNKAFPLNDIKNWADQLLNALIYLHSKGVVHRDIKPQNLKLTPRGQIILLDFGLAKGNPSDSKYQTAVKSVFGYSRNYASLEQMQGTGTEPRSDLYALGATLYHLATGTPPKDALTRAMDILSNKPDCLQPANIVQNTISTDFSNLLQNAMDLNANNRPASAKAMREMLNGNIEINVNRTVEFEMNDISDVPQVAENKPLNVPAETEVMIEETANKPFIQPAETEIMIAETAKIDEQPALVTELEVVSQNIVIDIPPQTIAKRFAAPQNNSKKGMFVTAGLSCLLLVGGVGATAYFVKPSLLGFKQNASSTEIENTTSVNPQTIEPKQEASDSNSIYATTEKLNNEVSNISSQSNDNQKNAISPSKKVAESKPEKSKDSVVENEDQKTTQDNPTRIKDSSEKNLTKAEIERAIPRQDRNKKQRYESLSLQEKEQLKLKLERKRLESLPSTGIPKKPQ